MGGDGKRGGGREREKESLLGTITHNGGIQGLTGVCD
jgi:hypothetical protein